MLIILLKNWVVKNPLIQPKNIALIMTNKHLILYVIPKKNHPSIWKIRSTITGKENSNNNTIFSPVNSDKVKQCIQKLNPSKAISQDNQK